MAGASLPMPVIRPAVLADADALAAFNVAMAWETERLQLLPDVVDAGVRRVLGDPALGFYLVAEEAGRAVGGLLVTSEWSDWRNGRFWWIQSVYVAPEARRRGLFQALYRHVWELASASADVCGVRLYVEQHNAAAQSTYRGLGMFQTEYRLMEALRPGLVWKQE
jgi:ribosomal protein S18 acetylase RimI-like enzyme